MALPFSRRRALLLAVLAPFSFARPSRGTPSVTLRNASGGFIKLTPEGIDIRADESSFRARMLLVQHDVEALGERWRRSNEALAEASFPPSGPISARFGEASVKVSESIIEIDAPRVMVSSPVRLGGRA